MPDRWQFWYDDLALAFWNREVEAEVEASANDRARPYSTGQHKTQLFCAKNLPVHELSSFRVYFSFLYFPGCPFIVGVFPMRPDAYGLGLQKHRVGEVGEKLSYSGSCLCRHRCSGTVTVNHPICPQVHFRNSGPAATAAAGRRP